jgi:hypothetical protein
MSLWIRPQHQTSLPTFRGNLLLPSAGSENYARKQIRRKESYSSRPIVKAVGSRKRLLTPTRLHGATSQQSQSWELQHNCCRAFTVPKYSWFIFTLIMDIAVFPAISGYMLFNYCMNVLFVCYVICSLCTELGRLLITAASGTSCTQIWTISAWLVDVMIFRSSFLNVRLYLKITFPRLLWWTY